MTVRRSTRESFRGVIDFEDAAIRKFERSLVRVHQRLDDRIRGLVSSFTGTDGRLIGGRKEIARLGAIQDQIRSALVEAGYEDSVRSFVSRYPELYKKLRTTMRDTVGPRGAFTLADLEAFRMSVAVQAQTFANIGDTASQALTRMLSSAVIGERNQADLMDEFRAAIIGSGRRDRAGQGMLRHAKTLADTGMAQLSRSMERRSSIRAGITAWVYFGPQDQVTRPFCRRLLVEAADGKEWSADEIEALDNGQTEAGSAFIAGGGFNCRHQWLPVTGVAVKRTPSPKKTPVPLPPVIPPLPRPAGQVGAPVTDSFVRIEAQMEATRGVNKKFIGQDIGGGNGGMSPHFTEAKFNGRPNTLRQERFREVWEQSPPERRMYRGVKPDTVRRAEEMVDQFKTGGRHVGHGLFGDGTYAASGEGGLHVAARFSQQQFTVSQLMQDSARANAEGRVMRMVLHPEARVISKTELEATYNRLAVEASKAGPSKVSKFNSTYGTGTNGDNLLATHLGYDAVYLPKSDRAAGMLSGAAEAAGKGDQWIVLNRGALVVQEETMVTSELLNPVKLGTKPVPSGFDSPPKRLLTDDDWDFN